MMGLLFLAVTPLPALATWLSLSFMVFHARSRQWGAMVAYLWIAIVFGGATINLAYKGYDRLFH